MRKLIRAMFFSVLVLALLALAGLAWMFSMRPGMESTRTHAYPVARSQDGPALVASWHGTTAVLLSDGQTSLFIDPFFTRPGGWLRLMLNRPIAPDEALIRTALAQSGAPSLAAVLVSHSHYDHAMDAGLVAKLTGAQLLGSASTANIGRGSGLAESQIRTIEPGRAMQFGRFTVTFLQSRHAGATGGRPTGDITEPLVPPAPYTQYRQGGAYSILIEHPLGTILHHGSAGWLPDMFEGRRADLVFLGIAAAPSPEDYLKQVVDAVGATRVIPTHWDDFTRPLSAALVPLPFGVDLDGFFSDAERLRPELKLQTLAPGQRVILFESRTMPTP